MPGSHVVVRMPSEGTLIGEAVARHPGAKVSCVLAGQHAHGGRSIIDHVALVEGLPDADVAGLLLAWSRHHGEAPQVLGGPFALRLPVALDARHSATVAACLQLAPDMPDLAQTLHGRLLELWSPCAGPDEAQQRVLALRQVCHGLPVVAVEVADPSAADAECWDVLRAAAHGLVPDCLAMA